MIDGLQARIHECLAPFVKDEPFALLDFPNIRNVGDSAIWLGEVAYFRKHIGRQPAYVSTGWTFSEASLKRHAPSGPIFIHGGGNFGDIWLGHQEFRERLLKRWPGRPIIQFPQSIHFGNPGRADETARIIGKHGNFTLLVRDEESKHFAEKRFDCRVILCPDMAFSIGPLEAAPPTIPLLAMLREDREKAGEHNLSAYPDVPVEDWITEPWLPIRISKLLGALGAAHTLDGALIRQGLFDAAANQRFGRGVRQLQRAQAIVTDRLHVHIISILLGRPHAVLDNSYGKIRRFMDAFSGGTDLVYRASSLPDAIQWANEAAGAAHPMK
ncbi:polysaccharide pyruvyl transferase family protein [uncultured Ramlibacter sp.]|uniref:polysaccharide pyruvyl transferase family protein n=1 Tax=uncultured Ramlibacter sp. TaxID=260755 RepID=UPI00261A4DF3|nr:polysaccharide pyruvyl transferase family protein [uncultured Ramlibacter sp.]